MSTAIEFGSAEAIRPMWYDPVRTDMRAMIEVAVE
jgi:hypothetical protein